ncbi:MAG: DMT family transporter [Patescibacteria group bacterium]
MNNFKNDYIFLILAAALSGFVVFGGKALSNTGLSLFEISLLPLAVILLVMIPFSFFSEQLQIRKKFLAVFILYGLVEAVITICQFGSVILGTPVSIALLLLYTQPLWTVILSHIFLKEKIHLFDIFACLLVIIGIIFLIGPWQVNDIGSLLGIVIALIGGIGLSLWVVIGSYASKKNNSPINTYIVSHLFMAIFLVVFFLIAKNIVVEPTLMNFSFHWPFKIWLSIAFFGLVAVLFNNVFYLKAVRTVPTVSAGIVMLLEPVVGTILAAIFFHQPITFSIIIGGVFILIANYLIITKK